MITEENLSGEGVSTHEYAPYPLGTGLEITEIDVQPQILSIQTETLLPLDENVTNASWSDPESRVSYEAIRDKDGDLFKIFATINDADQVYKRCRLFYDEENKTYAFEVLGRNNKKVIATIAGLAVATVAGVYGIHTLRRHKAK